MFKKLKLPIYAAVMALSLTTLSGTGLADRAEPPEPIVYVHEGKEFRAIPGEVLEPPKDAVPNIVSKEEIEQLEKLEIVNNERIQVENIGQLYPDQYGGTNIVDDTPVYYIKGQDTELEKKIKSLDPEAQISYVKFSEKELDEIEAKLHERTELGVQFVIKLVAINQVELMINEEVYNENKDELLRDIDPEAVKLRFGNYRFIDQSATIYPGEQIERQISSNNFRPCSAAFNGTAGSALVTVTAGHCGNGTYFDLSDSNSSIGTMNNATVWNNIDAGFIRLNSNASRSYYLNGSTKTIGTFDWNGGWHRVGNRVNLHATSTGSGSYSGTIQSASFSLDGLTDLVAVYPPFSQSGDSGGLWYRDITSNNRTYAVIEGVHKGIVADQFGFPVYSVYSKFANVYSELGMSGVFTDPSY
ncbi:chymotrypsin family serine protease [Paenibacillus senegalensis]|uniref:hypothetical protein n=1 Tax=Paenibacillus senegalensis TaxID=1465766 RepID=UPI0002891CA7|nr:hypothetical protein [Paenibacillus senegalensis]